MSEVLTSPIRVIKRLTSAKPDAHARLATAMQEVGRLRGELEAIRGKISQRTDTTRFTRHVEECRERFEREKSFESEREYILAQLILGVAVKQVQPFVVAKLKGYDAAEDEAFGSLFRQNPDWRETLKAACGLKLEIAQNEARNIESSVRKELGADFGDQAVSQHPRVRRSRHTVSMWKSLTSQCDSERDNAALWKRVVGNLKDVQ